MKSLHFLLKNLHFCIKLTDPAETKVPAIIREIYQSPACIYEAGSIKERSINRRHVYAIKHVPEPVQGGFDGLRLALPGPSHNVETARYHSAYCAVAELENSSF